MRTQKPGTRWAARSVAALAVVLVLVPGTAAAHASSGVSCSAGVSKAIGSARIDVSWPANAAATGYTLYLRESSADEWSYKATLSGGNTFTALSVASGTYDVRVTMRTASSSGTVVGEASCPAVVARTANSAATGELTISGTAQVGQTLTADTSGIADADGLTGVTYSYQWLHYQRGVNTGIAGATSSTYRLQASDENKRVRVRVTFTDNRNNEEDLWSDPTGPVAAAGGL